MKFYVLYYWDNLKVVEVEVIKEDKNYYIFDQYVGLSKVMAKCLLNIPRFTNDDGGFYTIVTDSLEEGTKILYKTMLEDVEAQMERLKFRIDKFKEMK